MQIPPAQASSPGRARSCLLSPQCCGHLPATAGSPARAREHAGAGQREPLPVRAAVSTARAPAPSRTRTRTRTVLCDATQGAPSQVQPGSRQDASSHPSNKVFLALPDVASPPELSNFESPGSEGATGGLLSWSPCRLGSRIQGNSLR